MMLIEGVVREYEGREGDVERLTMTHDQFHHLHPIPKDVLVVGCVLMECVSIVY